MTSPPFSPPFSAGLALRTPLLPERGERLGLFLVGQLQIDVLSSRMASEYNVAIGFEVAPYEMARWVSSGDLALLNRFVERHREAMAEDRDGSPVFLARNAWDLRTTIEEWPKIRFSATREQN